MKNIMKNSIGIDKEQASKLSRELNDLLANYQLFYQNLRGLHWNIKGKEFFELHVKFEEFYNDAVIKVDEIAERILTLEGEPFHTYSDYLQTAEINEEKNIVNGKLGVEIIINNFKILIAKERAILSLASNTEDEGTVSLMSDYISQTEKTLWMLNSYMS
jgi:starvation-inducible DNA-binding protein